MKKILVTLMLVSSLTACRSTNMQEEMDRINEEVNDGVNDIKDGVNDVREDVEDYSDEMKDDLKENAQDSNNPTASNLGLNLHELWMVPSFCNSVMGTTLFRGY